MKTYIAVFTLLLCSVVFAQEKTSYPKYALSFGIGENFKLTTFNMDFTFKKVFDENRQWRVYLSPGLSNSGSDSDTKYMTEPTLNRNERESDVNSWSLGLGSDYLWTILKEKSISMYGGPGLFASYLNSSSEDLTTDYDGNNVQKNKDEYDTDSFSSGCRGILGVEWKVRSNIGIHCEYVLNFSYNYYNQETIRYVDNEKIQESQRGQNSLSIYNGVLFGLSIYL